MPTRLPTASYYRAHRLLNLADLAFDRRRGPVIVVDIVRPRVPGVSVTCSSVWTSVSPR